ncbi:MAG: asparagine synthase (glutamine-hydrolyzing) [Maribacter sp.]|nr:asparagine synthase (glutamine-hydrolyzing) [Maribacter sp.]
MCGIAGYLHLDKHQPASSEVLKKMTDIIAHRGPDGEGGFIDSNLALGHRRLSIIDLKTGQQPMQYYDNSLIITYNGEIYNYVELRKELKKKGYCFYTDSDTEVILSAYKEWGINCVQRFNGMWAFALWDKSKKRLFCSRDRIGEKPFFYAVYQNSFIFGSEIKSLFAYGVPRVENLEVLDFYLCSNYIPAPYTFFKNIYKLKPGHSLIIENGKLKIDQYWDIVFPPESDMRKDKDNILEEFEHLFYDSVKIRMRSDVAFGAFLSGGLDSGSIVAAMTRFSKGLINTVTIGFDCKEFDERDLAKLVAERFRANHLERIIKKEDAESVMQKLSWYYDEPFGDSSALSTYIVSKAASESVKMVLTGDGGDEVLSGYTVHQGEKFSRQFSLLPNLIKTQMIPSGLSLFKFLCSGSLKRKILRADKVVKSANLNFVDRMEAKGSGFTHIERGKLIIDKKMIRPAKEFIEEGIKPVVESSDFTKLNYWLLKVSLPDNMLCKVDRASMANGLETRVPFLDHRIIELLSTVSMSIKMKGYKRKYILRETLGRQLPDKLLTARKRGFALPLREWFKNGSLSMTKQSSLQNVCSSIISKTAVEEIVHSNLAGKSDTSNAIWTLMMLGEVLK